MMLSLVRALLVGALLALAVPVGISLATMSGMAGPRYQIVDLLPFVAPIVGFYLLLVAMLAAALRPFVRIPRGWSDGALGTLAAAAVLSYGAGMSVFADLGLGPEVLTIIGAIVAVVSGVLAFIRWQLSGRPGA